MRRAPPGARRQPPAPPAAAGANATAVATSSVSPARAVAVIADTAGPGAEGSHALHSAEGGSALLPTATGPDALSRLRAACGAHPVRVAALGCLVAPAAYAVGKARSRCRRRSGGREPLRGSGAAEPALAMEEDLSPVYRGSFRHPAFEGEVPVVVRLDAAYRGSWLALGQTEEIDVCRSGSAVSLREVGGATILEGSIQSGTGAIFGTVVQDGVRGGAFELTPEPLGQEPPGWSPAAAPDASFVAQALSRACPSTGGKFKNSPNIVWGRFFVQDPPVGGHARPDAGAKARRPRRRRRAPDSPDGLLGRGGSTSSQHTLHVRRPPRGDARIQESDSMCASCRARSGRTARETVRYKMVILYARAGRTPPTRTYSGGAHQEAMSFSSWYPGFLRSARRAVTSRSR
ncbi:unnamed protein product [Prorocentrum cordatum]|uniref:Altered inheritance of mitochondria protein 24, mitochondrial n=1 Tax=Prorocentrum cordatum TaxID=2364126 RepID=A0ABN9TPA4_9DINO|nr:unnamed protein product [Polarella glacialis]